jgi:hypothetical protein
MTHLFDSATARDDNFESALDTCADVSVFHDQAVKDTYSKESRGLLQESLKQMMGKTDVSYLLGDLKIDGII